MVKISIHDERERMDNIRGGYAIDTNLLHNSLSRANPSFGDNLKMVNSSPFTRNCSSPNLSPTLY